MRKQKIHREERLDILEQVDVLENVRHMLSFTDVDDNDYIVGQLITLLQIQPGKAPKPLVKVVKE